MSPRSVSARASASWLPASCAASGGGLVQGQGLVPVSLAAQELVHRGRDRGGVPGPAARRGVAGRGVQVEPLGAQPGQGILAAGQLPGVRGRRDASAGAPAAMRLLRCWLAARAVCR